MVGKLLIEEQLIIFPIFIIRCAGFLFYIFQYLCWHIKKLFRLAICLRQEFIIRVFLLICMFPSCKSTIDVNHNNDNRHHHPFYDRRYRGCI